MVADWPNHMMAEELLDPPTKFSLDEMSGDSHEGKRENDRDAKDNTVCDDKKDYVLEEGGSPKDR